MMVVIPLYKKVLRCPWKRGRERTIGEMMMGRKGRPAGNLKEFQGRSESAENSDFGVSISARTY